MLTQLLNWLTFRIIYNRILYKYNCFFILHCMMHPEFSVASLRFLRWIPGVTLLIWASWMCLKLEPNILSKNVSPECGNGQWSRTWDNGYMVHYISRGSYKKGISIVISGSVLSQFSNHKKTRWKCKTVFSSTTVHLDISCLVCHYYALIFLTLILAISSRIFW